ncbi:MAG: DoxX family protein [Bacteroidetes bacterium]|jgi:hypothetical protein|nr:MAG: DoxX family protein [Bacteroidota bacterium]
MNAKTTRIIGWVLAILPSLLMIFSAFGKFTAASNPEMVEAFTKAGFYEVRIPLALFSLAIAALFLYPRTSAVGFVLMSSYFAGIAATELTHGMPMTVGPIGLVLIWISAYLRTPEVFSRLLGKTV